MLQPNWLRLIVQNPDSKTCCEKSLLKWWSKRPEITKDWAIIYKIHSYHIYCYGFLKQTMIFVRLRHEPIWKIDYITESTHFWVMLLIPVYLWIHDCDCVLPGRMGFSIRSVDGLGFLWWKKPRLLPPGVLSKEKNHNIQQPNPQESLSGSEIATSVACGSRIFRNNLEVWTLISKCISGSVLAVFQRVFLQMSIPSTQHGPCFFSIPVGYMGLVYWPTFPVFMWPFLSQCR